MALNIKASDARDIVARPLREIEPAGAVRYTIGSPAVARIERLGLECAVPFNALGWLATAQTLALCVARAPDVDSDAPRGLRKALAGQA